MKSFHYKTDIFFDLDHTLWDFEKNSALAFQKVFEIQNIPISLDVFLEHYIPINHNYWKLYQDNKVNQQDLRYYRLKDVFDILEFNTTDELIEEIATQYIDLLPTFNHLYEGTVELLEYLHPKYNLHIITNGFQEVQNGKLKNSNIEKYFQTVTNSEKAGAKKPNPYIFEYALEIANAKKDTSVMIGDNLEADVEGALGAGLEAILFNEFQEKITTVDYQVYCLLELKNYF